MIVRAATPAEFPWLLHRVDARATSGFKAIAAVDATGIRGMVGYDHWTPGSAHMLIALDAPTALRSLLVPAFHYLFVQAGRSVALTLVNDTNERSKRLTEHVGFRVAHRIRDGLASGIDMLMYELHKDDCRYLRRGD